MSKIVAVIGATGAQGIPTIKHLLAPSASGAPSPWKVRALTRNPDHRRAKELRALGAELIQGSYTDPNTIHRLFEGAHGAYVNTDGYTVGAAKELHTAFEIWEIAKYQKLRHFVWSNLDYAFKIGGFNPVYAADHCNAKGRFADYLSSQPSHIGRKEGTAWTVYTNGPYMELLGHHLLPFQILKDGTRVFASPFGDEQAETGRWALIALDDLGWWSRHIFDNPQMTVGKELKIASQVVSYPEIIRTFKRVTGLPAVYKSMSMDDYFAVWNRPEQRIAAGIPASESRTWEAVMRGFFAMWRDNIVTRDMNWIDSVHRMQTLEEWMRKTEYTGATRARQLLKGVEDHQTPPKLDLKYLDKYPSRTYD
ncbi:NAD(P)-binding protein [Clavulina sp. PMI_390]|nr:NAD(P)-binding protein [Clavulina sp. PMI_390]